MPYIYTRGCVRWKRFTGDYDVRLYRAPRGWKVEAEILDEHPVTGKQFVRGQWWIKETYVGE